MSGMSHAACRPRRSISSAISAGVRMVEVTIDGPATAVVVDPVSVCAARQAESAAMTPIKSVARSDDPTGRGYAD